VDISAVAIGWADGVAGIKGGGGDSGAAVAERKA
jgi:hypothetical protein